MTKRKQQIHKIINNNQKCHCHNRLREILSSNLIEQTQDWSDTGGGGLRYLEMLFRCNYLAMVGGGQNPRCGQCSSLDFTRDGPNPEFGDIFDVSEGISSLGIQETRSVFGTISKRRLSSNLNFQPR